MGQGCCAGAGAAQAALGPHPGVPFLALGSRKSPPAPEGSTPPVQAGLTGKGSGDTRSLSVPPGDAGSARHIPLYQAGLVAPQGTPRAGDGDHPPPGGW